MVESLLQRWVSGIRRDFEEMSTTSQHEGEEHGRSKRKQHRKMLPNNNQNVVTSDR